MGHGPELVALRDGNGGGDGGLFLSQGRRLGRNKLSALGRSRMKWRVLGRPPGGGSLGTRPIISHNSVVFYSLQRVFINIYVLGFSGSGNIGGFTSILQR